MQKNQHKKTKVIIIKLPFFSNSLYYLLLCYGSRRAIFSIDILSKIMNSLKFPVSFHRILKNTVLVTGGGIAIIGSIGLISVWQTSTNLFQTLTNSFKYQITSPKVDTSHLIVKQIQEVSELTTTNFVMDAVIPTSSSRKVGDWVIGETKLLYLARGEVKAGLDLSQIKTEDVIITGNNIEITLPAPQILDSKIDVTQSQVYDYDRGFLNLGPDVAPELQTQAQRQTLAKVVSTACNEGILTQANQRATLIVTQLLTTGGYDNVTIKTTEPQSCLSNL